MTLTHWLRVTLGLLLAAGLLFAADDGPPTDKTLSRPVPVAVASVRVLMDNLNGPSFQQLDHVLRSQPTAQQTWKGMAVQAVLLAEGGNLLLLRPPRGKQAGTWLDRATELRLRAVDLSQAAEKHDFATARKALKSLGESCMHCHQTFNVPVKVEAFASQPVRSTNATSNVPQAPLPPAVPQPPVPRPPPAPPQPPGPPPQS